MAGTFAPAAGETPASAGIAATDSTSGGARTSDGRLLYLVQFDGPILAEWRAALEASGAEIRDYIPDFCYEVAVADEDVAALKALPGVIWTGPFVSAYGVSPEVASIESATPQAARPSWTRPPATNSSPGWTPWAWS